MRPLLSSDQRNSFAKSCNHYENRARFLPRAQPVDFVVLLAEACSAARISLDGTSTERMAAADFLSRLVALNTEITAINVARVFGPEAEPASKPMRRGGLLRPIGNVSATGEFLIAHRMGLLSAFDRWRETSPDFPLALHARR